MKQEKKYLDNHKKTWLKKWKMKDAEEKYLYDLIFKYGCLVSENGEILTENKLINESIKEHYGDKDFWNGVSTYSISQYFPSVSEKVKVFMDSQIIPFVSKDTEMFSMACGSGENEFYLADRVKLIDGYEYSEKMVRTATEQANKLGIENTKFNQANAANCRFNKVYDAGMSFALFAYLDDEAAIFASQNLADSIKTGGKLYLRDTVNVCGEDMVYLFNYANGFESQYRSYDNYMKLLREAGLKLEYEEVANVSFICGKEFHLLNSVWRK